MSGPARTGPAQKVTIVSAGDLFGALRSDAPALRLFVLKAIADNPGKALSYGAFQGRELYDEVATHWQRSGADADERAISLAALLALDPGKAFAPCRSDFSFSRNRIVLQVAAARLAAEPAERRADVLRPFLFDDALPVRTRLTASLMSDIPSLSPRERLRVAAVSMEPGACVPPLPGPGTEQYWASELDGVWAEEIKAMAEGLGEDTFRGLISIADRLSGSVKQWLVEWGMREYPFYAAGLTADLLRSGDAELVLATLRCIGRNQTAAGLFQALVNGLTIHPQPAVRAAALDAGAVVDAAPARRMLATEAIEVRLALIRSIARSKNREYAHDVAGLFRDEDWRIRAAASRALADMGGLVIDVVRSYLRDPDERTRVAAVGALLALDGETLAAGEA